jgi:hypothetical protein
MLEQMPDDRGGSVLVYAARIAFARGPRLLPDYAASAATMWLGYENAYVHPEATFGFHRVRRDWTGIATAVYEAHLRRAHPELLDWFRGIPNDSDAIVKLPGRVLIKRGWARSIELRDSHN